MDVGPPDRLDVSRCWTSTVVGECGQRPGCDPCEPYSGAESGDRKVGSGARKCRCGSGSFIGCSNVWLWSCDYPATSAPRADRCPCAPVVVASAMGGECCHHGRCDLVA